MTKEVMLGTANLGTPYGATNSGEFDPIKSSEILGFALNSGINGFDTAPDYGVAEQLIGRALNGSYSQKIITKIPKMHDYTFEQINESLKKSLRELRTPSIYGLLFHDPEIWQVERISDITKKLFDTGLVERIGISTYDEKTIQLGTKVVPEWNLFQVPENVVDRRLVNSGFLNEMRESGRDLYVRSVFLQGMLVQTKNIPNTIYPRIWNELNAFYSYIQEQNFSAIDLCMSYANSITWSTGTIVAAASERQLQDIQNFKRLELDFSEVPKLKDEYLDPRTWR